MKRLLIIACLLRLAPSPVIAQGDGGYAGAALCMGLGARAVGLGNAFVGLADDAYAGYYNPAALPWLSSRQIALTYSFLTLDRVVQYVGYAQNLPPTAGISIGWLRAGTDEIDGRDFSGEHTEFISEAFDVFSFSFAIRPHPKIAAGLTIKLLQHDLTETKATDVAFDLGLMLRLTESIRLGAQLKDYQGSLTWDTQNVYARGSTTVDDIPVIARLGASWTVADMVTFAADAEFNEKQQERIHVGAELRRNSSYAIRAGMDDSRPSIGAGLYFDIFGGADAVLDYTLLGGLVGEGETHLFSWLFLF